jgi:hypothetical protein
MVYDMILIHQQLPRFFSADNLSQLYLRLQSGAVMASSSEGLFEEEIEQALLEELTDSDQCSSSSDDESSGTDDLAMDEVIAMECSDEKDDIVRGASAPSVPSAISASRMNYASPVQGTCGRLLFIQAKTLYSKQHQFQATKTKQRQLCCYLWSHS